MDRVILRDANPTSIQHNKFMVLLKGKAGKPVEVWTGSTNISEGGFTGQTNVGHWVRNAAVARSYLAYWEVVATNGGSRKRDKDARDEEGRVSAAGRSHRRGAGDGRAIPKGVTAVFSPRRGTKVLDLYVKLADEATSAACVTLAFGINAAFKQALQNNTSESSVVVPAAREEGRAERPQHEAVRGDQREEQRLQGLGVLPA